MRLFLPRCSPDVVNYFIVFRGRGRGLTAVLIVLAAVTAAGYAYSAEKHQCDNCHLFSDKTSGAPLKASLSGLCLGCHQAGKASGEHKVDIIPSMKVEDLPLTTDGKMSCVTCHDPHGKSGQPKLLRVKQSELCLKCHFR